MKKYIALIGVFLTLIFPHQSISKEKDQTVAQKPVVVIETNQGSIEVELLPQSAPKTCENFLGLIEKEYYNGIIFHRVIKNFMLQTGDPTGTGTGGNSIWGAPFEDEVTTELSFNSPGILAMANAGPNTNGSQFFITTTETPWLDGNHTIFGKVTKGMDIVTKIENTSTDRGDKPTSTQKMIKVYLKK